MTTLYTIGYEGTDIERFVATLAAIRIEVLADVRAVTVSRKPGFSKTRLRQRLEQAGITYRHFGELGDPKHGREAARAGRFAEFQRIYGSHLSSDPAQGALGELARVVEGQATCLMCFERDPKVCHRSIVARALAGAGVSIFDLFGDDPGRYERHAAKLSRCHPSQGVAAAQ